MLRTITEEFDVSVARENVGNEIATQVLLVQDGVQDGTYKTKKTLGKVTNNLPNDQNSGVSYEKIYCVADGLNIMSQNEIGSEISIGLLVSTRDGAVDETPENSIETCEHQGILLCVDDTEMQELSSVGHTTNEHDYVRVVTDENCDASASTVEINEETSEETVNKHLEKSGLLVKKIVLPVRDISDRPRPVWPLLNTVSADNPTVGKCRPPFSKPSKSKPRSSEQLALGVGCGSKTRDKPSVLRTLLQASRKQLKLYQTYNHSSRRLHLSSPAVTVVQTLNQAVKRKDFGCQANLAQVENSEAMVQSVQLHTKTEQSGNEECQHQSVSDNRSQIKALLMGQGYERVPHTEALAGESVEWESSQTKKTCYGHRYTRTQGHDLSIFLCAVVDMVSEYKDLSYSVQSSRNKSRSIEVRRKGLYGIPSPGMNPAQVIVEEDGTAHFFILVKIVFSVLCKDEDGQVIPDPLLQMLQKLSIKGGHVFCPGVELALALVAPNTKNLVFCDLLEPRYQAKDCPIWHMLGSNQSWLPLNEGVHKCKNCKSLERYLRTVVKAKGRRDLAEGNSDIRLRDVLSDWETE